MKRFAVVFPILFIVLLATLFHFEIHFENALTELPEIDFGIKISVWRTIFEPFFGPLLFFNRTLYAIEEIPLALLWALIFYMVFASIEIFRAKGKRTKVVLGKISNLPMLVGIGFAIFVFILFIPLPNNTIINHSKDAVLVTTHAHTEFSHDGLISQEGMLKWHRKNGFDAFFITDHANHKKSLQFAQRQRNKEFGIDPLVLVGQEYSGSNHMSLLGLNGKFETKGMSDEAVVDAVHRYGGAVIINHWFDGKGETKEFYNELGADGFEIENVGTELYYDRELFAELKKFCGKNGLMMIGGLDFHGYGRACALYNAFEIPDWKIMEPRAKERAILEILKKGPQRKIRVLMYKDRPYYSNSYLIFRPFLTVIDYFKTLELMQVLSWVFWLIIFQILINRKESIFASMNNKILILSGASAVFLTVLAMVYFFKDCAIKGYSKVYAEYYLILGAIGIFLMVYTVVLGYFRFNKRGKNRG